MSAATAILSGVAEAQYVELGAFGDYTRSNIAGFAQNAFGLGGRANINLHRYLQLELETAYDVKHLNVAVSTGSTSTTLTDSRLGILHLNGGLKLQTRGGSFFIFAKGGANRYDPERSITTASGTPPTLSTVSVPLDSFTHGIFYPGGGVGFHAGPLGIRFDVGDEIFWSNGAHHNLRVTFGPTFRF